MGERNIQESLIGSGRRICKACSDSSIRSQKEVLMVSLERYLDDRKMKMV